VSPTAHPDNDTTTGSRIDRLALRLTKRSRTPVTAPPAAVSDDGQLSRRKLLARGLGASTVMMFPLRLASPTTASAEAYCAGQCLNDANTADLARLTTCGKTAFGVDLPTLQDYISYVASKIKFGGLGGLVIITETARYDVCTVASEIRYYHDAGQCGKANCGNAKKYPRPATGACQNCNPGYHCCVCRDYNDGKPLPNVLVNGGYSCSVYCTSLGFTVISDTLC
jgi:hypothetical protein